MSAFPFARDMKVCDSKGAIQTTLLVDNYIVSARLRVGLMPIAQGSWELLCIFFPAEFLTNWQHIAEMVPPFLRSPMPFVWAILQSTFVWDSSAACGKKITSHAWGPYPANPFVVLCALWPCALLSLLSWGRGGRWTRDEERRGEERKMGMVVGETRVWLWPITGCPLLGDAGPAPSFCPVPPLLPLPHAGSFILALSWFSFLKPQKTNPAKKQRVIWTAEVNWLTAGWDEHWVWQPAAEGRRSRDWEHWRRGWWGPHVTP